MNGKEICSMSFIEQLKADGWEIREGHTSNLVSVSSQGLLHCVDGRMGNGSVEQMKGPKIQGGVLGVAALLGDCSRRGIQTAIEVVKKAGFVPSMHEDDHHGPAGCGFARLLSEGKLSGMPSLDGVTIKDVGEMVKAAGGVVVTLTGAHAEQVVRVNLVSGTTMAPDGSGFMLDAWAADQLGLDTDRLMQNAIETVRLLNGPWVIELYQ